MSLMEWVRCLEIYHDDDTQIRCSQLKIMFHCEVSAVPAYNIVPGVETTETHFKNIC